MKKFEFTISGNNYGVEIIKFEDNIAKVEVNGTQYKVEVHSNKQTTKTPTLVRKAMPTNGGSKIKKSVPTGGFKVVAPLPGTIVQLKVAVGDEVKKGQKVLIMEAMKMENDIHTEKDGIVKKIHVAPADAVLQGDLLIDIE